MMRTIVLTMLCLCCSLLAVAQTQYEVTTNTFLNIRSYADADAPVLGTVNKGEKVDVYEISNGWAKIDYDGGYAYVNSAYLKKAQKVSSVVPVKDNGEIDFSSWSFNLDGVEWMAYVIAVLSIGLYLIRRSRGDGAPLDDSEMLYKVNWILFLTVTVLELVYLAIMGSDAIWFCSPDEVGWLWTIIDFFIFAFIVYNQFMCFFNTLEDVVYNSCGSFDRRWGFYSWAGGIVGGIITGIFFHAAVPYVLVAFVICQIIQIVLIFRGVVPRGGLKYAFLCTAVYLLGSISTVWILGHFVLLLLIVLAGYLILSILGSSSRRTDSSSEGSSRRRCCENCRSYYGDKKYCSYRDGYIGDAYNRVCDEYVEW